MRARSYLIPVVLGLLIVAVAVTGRWWLPPLLEFAGSNKDAIDSLTKLLQALLALLGLIVATIVPFLNRLHVGTDTKEGIKEAPPDEPKEDQPAPITEPLEPYFAHPYPLQENFTGRVSERVMLTKWLVGEQHPVLALTAIGGMGKSALTWAWL